MNFKMKTLISWTVVLGFCLASSHVALGQRYFGGGGGGFGGGGGGFRGFGGGGGGYGGGGGSSAFGSDGAKQMGTALIQYDPDTGSVIVVSDEETNDRIKQVVEGMDKPVPQVLIKVLFLEVTHGNQLDLGVEADFKHVTDNGKTTQDIGSLFGTASAITDTVSATGGGGFYKIISDDVAATIHAISLSNKLEVLSRPSIMTRNNQLATITVGQEVPFVTNTQVTNQGQTINTIQYSDIGIILRVTPHIAPDRMVEMQISPEISTLSAEKVPISDNLDAFVVNKRSADTRVLVGDGRTVVIGGMMGTSNVENVSKVPILGDIPYVGAFFRRTESEKSKTELLIFLTPKVVEAPEEMQKVSNAEKNNTQIAPKAFSQEDMDHYINTLPEADPKVKAQPQVQMTPSSARNQTPESRQSRVNREIEAQSTFTKPKPKVTGLIKAETIKAPPAKGTGN